MSEIYKERLEVHGDDYHSQTRALEEAANIATDETSFTLKQIRANLTELSEIAEDEGLDSTYVDLLLEVNLDKGE